jgi:two-component system chemotaxis response regulator CheB
LVVVGASAGGVEALLRLVGALPDDFPAPVLVVLHIAPSGTSVLPTILARAARVPVGAAQDGERLVPGRVYVAPPDHHLMVGDGRLQLTKTPRENGHRPAIDPTMRSAARSYDGGTVGVILSGSRDDGTMGLVAIKQAGGLAVVQEPAEALYGSMPLSAIGHVDVDAVLSLERIPEWIMEQRRVPAGKGADVGDPQNEHDGPHPPGEGTRFTCPDCGGVLFERDDGQIVRFQCSVGHIYGIESLAQAQSAVLEHALWAAVRSLEDRAVLLDRMEQRAEQSDQPLAARSFHDQAADARRRAEVIRDAIVQARDGAGETTETEIAEA